MVIQNIHNSMKKNFSAIFLLALIYLVVFGTSSVSAQVNSNNSPTSKKLALSGWDKTVSWFKKTILPAKPVEVPSVPVGQKVAPNKLKPVSSSTQKSKITNVKKKNIPKTVQKQQNVINKNVVEKKQEVPVLYEEVDKNISPLSEEMTANFFLSAEKLKHLPDVSTLLKTFPFLQIHDVNVSGDFVGCVAKTLWDTNRAFAKIKEKFYYIGTIDDSYPCARGINDKGQVVGATFLWENGKVTKLPNLASGDGVIGKATAEDINNNGIIIGHATVQFNKKYGVYIDHAVRWVNGQIEDLSKDKVDTNNWAVDINERDQILISSNPVSIWQNGRAVTVNDLVPKLEKGEFVKVDGGFADEPEFAMDGSLKLRVDKRDLITKIINGDEHSTSVLSHLRYYQINLPADISTIKIEPEKAAGFAEPNTAYPTVVN